MPEPQYDPLTCVTAGELRQVGLNFAGDLPDEAWIPRASLMPVPATLVVTPHPQDPSRLVLLMSFAPTEPFRWVEASVPVTE